MVRTRLPNGGEQTRIMALNDDIFSGSIANPEKPQGSTRSYAAKTMNSIHRALQRGPVLCARCLRRNDLELIPVYAQPGSHGEVEPVSEALDFLDSRSCAHRYEEEMRDVLEDREDIWKEDLKEEQWKQYGD